jgi:hypothetical protein
VGLAVEFVLEKCRQILMISQRRNGQSFARTGGKYESRSVLCYAPGFVPWDRIDVTFYQAKAITNATTRLQLNDNLKLRDQGVVFATLIA